MYFFLYKILELFMKRRLCYDDKNDERRKLVWI